MRSNTKKVLRFANPKCFDLDDNEFIEFNLNNHPNPNLDKFCKQFAEHKLISFKEILSDCEREELAKQSIKNAIDGDWQTCTEKSVFKIVSGFLTVANGLLHNGTRPYLSQRMRNVVIEQAHITHPSAQVT